MQTEIGTALGRTQGERFQRQASYDRKTSASKIAAEMPMAESAVPPRLADIGARLADLAPAIHALGGSRIDIDTEIALPHSQVRVARDAFDRAVLELVANALAAGAETIRLRTRMAGAHIWMLACDDGLSPCPSQKDAVASTRRFARMTHGRLFMRSRPGGGNAVALVLPTVLSLAGAARLSNSSDSLKPKEMTHEEDRQPIAA